jgi:membrane protease subunit HflK
MLTGDENIINVQFTIQYRIVDLEKYVYNLTDPESSVQAAGESAMREVIGDTKVMDVLTIGKGLIETNTQALLEETLGSYDSGISIVNVKLQDVHPPDEVKEAFKDVVSAREDRQKMINEAEGYKNNLIPKARGEGVQIVNEAEAYAEETVLLAQGKAKRFEQMYAEYRNAEDITRTRIYIETMEQILPRMNKVVTDENVGQNFLPFLPINEMRTAARDTDPTTARASR